MPIRRVASIHLKKVIPKILAGHNRALTQTSKFKYLAPRTFAKNVGFNWSKGNVFGRSNRKLRAKKLKTFRKNVRRFGGTMIGRKLGTSSPYIPLSTTRKLLVNNVKKSSVTGTKYHSIDYATKKSLRKIKNRKSYVKGLGRELRIAKRLSTDTYGTHFSLKGLKGDPTFPRGNVIRQKVAKSMKAARAERNLAPTDFSNNMWKKSYKRRMAAKKEKRHPLMRIDRKARADYLRAERQSRRR